MAYRVTLSDLGDILHIASLSKCNFSQRSFRLAAAADAPSVCDSPVSGILI